MNISYHNPELERLQNEWKEMYQHTLPRAAASKSSAQSKWPVHVDHCFARIILDSVVGTDAPWMLKIKSPAYQNMSKEQLEASIVLGQKILDGEADLVELNNFSLQVRGKGKGASGKGSGKIGKAEVEKLEKRKRDGNEIRENLDEEEEEEDKASKRIKSSHSPPSKRTLTEEESKSSPQEPSLNMAEEDLVPYLKKIALSKKTDFQKKVLTALCQVPRGRYSTYGVIAKHLSSSPRAVGNALRNNPFAPMVPCHRILASGGGLGGFHGSWGRKGEEGLHDDKKRKLLREEGVRFDGKGKVVGAPWEDFKSFKP